MESVTCEDDLLSVVKVGGGVVLDKVVSQQHADPCRPMQLEVQLAKGKPVKIICSLLLKSVVKISPETRWVLMVFRFK